MLTNLLLLSHSVQTISTRCFLKYLSLYSCIQNWHGRNRNCRRCEFIINLLFSICIMINKLSKYINVQPLVIITDKELKSLGKQTISGPSFFLRLHRCNTSCQFILQIIQNCLTFTCESQGQISLPQLVISLESLFCRLSKLAIFCGVEF